MPSELGLHHERRDAALVTLGLRDARHDDEQIGDDSVGRPELHPVEDVVVAVRDGARGEPRRVGADVRLGEEEGRDVGAGTARQEDVLLLLGAEELQRLRYADRLVRRQQGADRRARGADEGERLVVVHLGEAEASVLGVDLHAEGADVLEAVDDLVGDLCLALDTGRVDLRLAEVAQLGEELLAALYVVLGGHGMRVDQIEAEATEEQFLGEAGLAPVLFAGRLRDLSCLTFSDGGLVGCCGHEAHLAAHRDLGDLRY